MEINEYQKMALETSVYPKEFKTIYPALGMNGEAGWWWMSYCGDERIAYIDNEKAVQVQA